MLTCPALSLKFVASGLSDWTIYYVSAEPIRHFKLWAVKGSWPDVEFLPPGEVGILM